MKVRKIIVHCSATKVGVNFDAADIDRWHRERGFKQIGYHYVVLLDGTIQEGRPEGVPGAHCKGHNSDSIGVCYIGGLDGNSRPKDTRTVAQRAALKELISRLRVKYPNARVHSHYEFARKACPCFDAHAEYDR